MKKRARITALITTLCLCLSLFVVGVLAATSATFNVTSTLNFTADGVYVMVDASLKQGADVATAAVLSGEGAPGQPTFKAYSYPRMATGTTPDAPNGQPSTTHFVNESGVKVDTWAIGDINYTSTNKVVVYEFMVYNYSNFEVQGTVEGVSEVLDTYVTSGQLTIETYTGTTSADAVTTGSPTYNFTIPARTNETTPGQSCYKIAVILNNFMNNLVTGTIEMNVSFEEYEEPLYRIEQETIDGFDYTFVYFGNYPQTYVGNDLNTTLENLYAASSSSLVATGKTYTAYDAGVPKTPYIEYEYNSEDYVRVPQADPGTQTFNDGTIIENGESYWFKVEPIQWRVLTESYTDTENTTPVYYILSEYCLTSNIDNSVRYSDETNILRIFLNSNFYDEAFTNEEKEFIKQRTLTTEDIGGNVSTEPLNVFAPTYSDLTEVDYGFTQSVYDDDLHKKRDTISTDFTRANNGIDSYWASSYIRGTGYYVSAGSGYISGDIFSGPRSSISIRPALLFNH